MSDFARLKEKLGKLRQVEPRAGAARVLAGHDAEARMRAVLSEIDEIILPRSLAFRSDAGEVALGVANRQVALILTGGAAHVIAGRDDDRLTALRDDLARLLAGAGAVGVETGRLDRGTIAQMRPDAAVGASALATLWGVAQATEDADASRVARRFIDRVAGRCDAWLLIEGEEISDSGGSASAIDWLSERAGGFLDGFYARRDAFPSDQPIALAFSGGTGASLIYFESGPQAGFATLPPDRLAAALGDWSASLTR